MAKKIVMESIKELVFSQPINIPAFYKVALRLQQLMNDDSYRIEEVIILVNEDPALASEMLRHANTPYYSGNTPITTIKNAIVRLGSQQIVNLAFTASMANSKSNNPVINKHMESLWHHSHAIAIASACLAVQVSHDKKLQDIDPDEVYLAGLLHDIGKLYLLKAIDNLIIAGQLEADNNIINEILNEHFIQQGIRVMNIWNIPQIYSNAVERLSASNWKCGLNDYMVAVVRLTCKLHYYIDHEVDLSDTSDAFDNIKDEMAFLNIEDEAYIYELVKSIK